MTQSATWDTLQIARDARLCGLMSQYEALLAEAAPDFEYVRRSHRRYLWPFEFFEEHDEDEPESYADQRRRWVLEMRRQFARDWLKWSDPLKTTSFDRMMREMYPPEAISDMAFRTNPSWAALTKQGDGDGFEMRIRSWANYIVPVRGVFTVD